MNYAYFLLGNGISLKTTVLQFVSVTQYTTWQCSPHLQPITLKDIPIMAITYYTLALPYCLL